MTAALLALQVAMAFSGAAEQALTNRQVTHVHDQQRHHGLTHDDANCAVCAVRTQVAEAARLPAGPSDVAPPREPAIALAAAVPSRPTVGAHTSRAPPVPA